MAQPLLKVVFGVLVVIEWIVIALVGGLLLWAFLAWLIPSGSCTGITCW